MVAPPPRPVLEKAATRGSYDRGMLRYREIRPRASLAGAVHRLWCLAHADPPPTPERILPDGHPELIFQLGAPYRSAGDGDVQSRSFVVGQMRGWLDVIPTGHVELLGVSFRPSGLHGLFRDSLHVLTDGELPLADWAPPPLAELEERLRQTAGWGARLELVQDVLEGELGAVSRPDARLAGAVDLLLASHGRLRLDELTARTGQSPRTLERGFRRAVGIGPKLLARQARFQRALELVQRAPRLPWSELALASGCYDQAHLVREFRAFAGDTPESFVRAEHALSDRLTGA